MWMKQYIYSRLCIQIISKAKDVRSHHGKFLDDEFLVSDVGIAAVQVVKVVT
jgi:hypothetical protein